MSAIPARDWTGPSWRKSASRRRSSCSAVIKRSASRAASSSSGGTWPLVDDRVAEGDRDSMRPGVCLELGEDVADVALHGLLADEQPLRDVGVRHAVSEQLQDLAL